MGMKEKMHTGELYLPGDEEILTGQTKRLEMLYDFNMTRPSELEKRQKMLKEMFAEIGENCYIEPPFHSNFGGGHVHFGKNCWLGAGVIVMHGITIGDNVVIAREVSLQRTCRQMWSLWEIPAKYSARQTNTTGNIISMTGKSPPSFYNT